MKHEQDELAGLLALVHRGHPDSTIDVAILRRHGVTAYGCMRQAIVELTSRVEYLLDFLSNWNSKTTRKLSPQRKRQRLRSAVSVAREAARFLGHAKHLARLLGPIDDTRRHELERELMEAVVLRSALIGVLAGGRVATSAWDAALAMPRADRERFEYLFTHIPDLRRRFDELAQDGMIDLPPITDDDVRALLVELAAKFPEVSRVAELGAACRVVDDRDVLFAVEGVAHHARGRNGAAGHRQLEGDDALRRGGISPHICAEG